MNNSEKNAVYVKRGYAAFNTGDIETLTAIFREDACWYTPGGKVH